MRAAKCWHRAAEAARQGPGPHAPRSPAASRAHRGAFVCAQPASVTPPRERTGRSPAADCSRRAWPPLGPCFISAAPGAGGGGQPALDGSRSTPLGPQHPQPSGPERGELRAAGKGLCLGTAPWAIRDPHMAGTDGGCSRGGQRGHHRGHCRALVPVPCSPWGSGLEVGLAWAVGALLLGAVEKCRGSRAPGEVARACPAVPGLLPATEPSLLSQHGAAGRVALRAGATGAGCWGAGPAQSNGPSKLGVGLLVPWTWGAGCQPAECWSVAPVGSHGPRE